MIVFTRWKHPMHGAQADNIRRSILKRSYYCERSSMSLGSPLIVLSPQTSTFRRRWGICVTPLAIYNASDDVLFPDKISRKHVSIQGQFPQVILGAEGKWEMVQQAVHSIL